MSCNLDKFFTILHSVGGTCTVLFYMLLADRYVLVHVVRVCVPLEIGPLWKIKSPSDPSKFEIKSLWHSLFASPSLLSPIYP
jgi:hypothetical protein